jgi:uncharacterized protein (DUF305 family)
MRVLFRSPPQLLCWALLGALALPGCGGAGRSPAAAPVLAPGSGPQPLGAGPSAAPVARPLTVNAADVEFMTGMIPHHAQAVLIAGWAGTHGARDDVRILCERQVVAQRDEIRLMQAWLRDRGLPVPDENATHHRHVMNGVEHDMLMPGMLTDEELDQLNKARGPEWDRLFLTLRIKHHEGALLMVEQLFASHGAAQDEDVFRLASDIYADQITEIYFMRKMLAEGSEKR